MGPRKPIIGLAGGIGSGKSSVASILRDLGAEVISSDELSRQEMNTPAVIAQLRGWWGDEVIGANGLANREALRRIVARDPSARKRLEDLLHPRVAQRREELMRQYAADPRIRAVVWDSPLLYEAGLAEQCDHVIFVEADESVRLERVARTRGWSAEQFRVLESAQKPLDFKRSRADYLVRNNSDFEALHRQVEEIFSQILSGS